MLSLLNSLFKILFFPVLALLGGASLVAAYMNWGNPNVQFQRQVVGAQFEALEKSRSSEKRVLVVGGSNVSFSIQPKLLRDEFGLEVLNMGLPAGAGRGLHCEWALQEVREGDLVVLCFESTGWTIAEDSLVTPLGSQFWYLVVGPQYGFQSQLATLGTQERYDWADVRPGGKHLFTLGAKVAFKQPLFRYTEENLREGGYLQGTGDWKIQPGNELLELELAPLQKDLLVRMKATVEEKGAQLCISFPWRLTAQPLAQEQRKLNQRLIGELSLFAPVLVDERIGVCTRQEWYADTHWHLTREGAVERSRVFAQGVSALRNSG